MDAKRVELSGAPFLRGKLEIPTFAFATCGADRLASANGKPTALTIE